MKFKEKKVTIKGEDFVLREGTMDVMLPILGKFADPEANKFEAQMELLKVVVFKDGQLVGDDVGKLPSSCYLHLLTPALEVCGMSDD
jgi:hypothetical protein